MKNLTKSIKVKRKRERDQARITRFVMWYALCVGTIFIIARFSGVGVFHIGNIVLLIIALPICLLADYIVERLGSGLGGFLSGWSSRAATLRETLTADMQKARYSKREGRFEEALAIVDGVLEKDPKYPDAHFLKARILWDGFGNGEGAKGCLETVLQIAPKGETLHLWARSLYDEITEGERE
jgi:tetratricopeptide (TPR) repeat protein